MYKLQTKAKVILLIGLCLFLSGCILLDMLDSLNETRHYVFAREGKVRQNGDSNWTDIQFSQNSSFYNNDFKTVYIKNYLIETNFPVSPSFADTTYYHPKQVIYGDTGLFKVNDTTPTIRGGYITRVPFKTPDSTLWNSIDTIYGDVESNWEILQRIAYKYVLYWNENDTLEECIDFFHVETDIID